MTHRIAALLHPVLGLPCWQVQWERHTNLTMQFGPPSLVIREPYHTSATDPRLREFASYRHVALRGAWMLWILHAYWRLRLRDGQVITGASSQRRQQYGLTLLDGQYLHSVAIAPTSGQTTFTFDLGAELTVRRWRHADAELWMLYTPDASVVTIRSDGQWQQTHETASPSESTSWSPLHQAIMVVGQHYRKAQQH